MTNDPSIATGGNAAFRRRIFLPCIVLVLISTVPNPGYAQDMTVDIGTQVAIFQTLLTFERTHRADSTGFVRTAVIYQRGFRKSVVARDEVVVFLRETKNGRCAPAYAVDVDLDSDDLATVLSQKDITAIIVCPLRSFSIASVASFSRKYGLLSFTLVPEYVAKGMSVGIDIKNAKPMILLNRTAAKRENADFDSRILNFVKIIDSSGE